MDAFSCPESSVRIKIWEKVKSKPTVKETDIYSFIFGRELGIKVFRKQP